MKKILLCDGDSWTAGDIVDPELFGDNLSEVNHPDNAQYRYPRVWPHKLGKLLDVDVINSSISGSSNDAIVRRAVGVVIDLLKAYQPNEIYVIIGWTSPERRDFYYRGYWDDSFIESWETLYPSQPDMKWPSKELTTFSNEDCNFGYRDSIFKETLKDKFIITKVEFKLSKIALNKTNYGAIERELRNLNLQPSPNNIAEAVIGIRSRKLPNPSEIGNSGSFFKNPIIKTSNFKELQKQFPEMVGHKVSEEETKIAAGWLIENAGLKGYRKGDAGVHKKLFL